jgi:hypothetical protein
MYVILPAATRTSRESKQDTETCRGFILAARGLPLLPAVIYTPLEKGQRVCQGRRGLVTSHVATTPTSAIPCLSREAWVAGWLMGNIMSHSNNCIHVCHFVSKQLPWFYKGREQTGKDVRKFHCSYWEPSFHATSILK